MEGEGCGVIDKSLLMIDRTLTPKQSDIIIAVIRFRPKAIISEIRLNLDYDPR